MSSHPKLAPARKGFALLAVLWAMVGITALALAISLAADDALAGARNRVAMIRGQWAAEGCVERVRAVLDASLGGEVGRATRAWRNLDSIARESAALDGCDLSLEPTGVRADINAASAEQLRALAIAMGAAPTGADSIADAILDWRDVDALTRPAGAEHSWYAQEGAAAPRDAPFAAAAEARHVRGVDELEGFVEAIDVEQGRVLLLRAPPTLLATLPGMGPEAIARLVEWRAAGRTPDLLALATSLSPEARDTLLARYQDLLPLVAIEPDAWILTSTAVGGLAADGGAVRSSLQLRLVRSGPRVALVRRRSTP